MPTSVYIESPDSSSNRLKPNLDGSANINVINTPTVTVSGTVPVSVASTLNVAVTNTPTVSVSGTVPVSSPAPAFTDLLSKSLAATGTLFTVPAGRVWKGSIALSASITLAGSATCSVSASSTGGTSGTLHNLVCQGLALTVVNNASTLNSVYIHGGISGATVTFTAGAAGVSSGQASGRLL